MIDFLFYWAQQKAHIYLFHIEASRCDGVTFIWLKNRLEHVSKPFRCFATITYEFSVFGVRLWNPKQRKVEFLQSISLAGFYA